MIAVSTLCLLSWLLGREGARLRWASCVFLLSVCPNACAHFGTLWIFCSQDYTRLLARYDANERAACPIMQQVPVGAAAVDGELGAMVVRARAKDLASLWVLVYEIPDNIANSSSAG